MPGIIYVALLATVGIEGCKTAERRRVTNLLMALRCVGPVGDAAVQEILKSVAPDAKLMPTRRAPYREGFSRFVHVRRVGYDGAVRYARETPASLPDDAVLGIDTTPAEPLRDVRRVEEFPRDTRLDCKFVLQDWLALEKLSSRGNLNTMNHHEPIGVIFDMDGVLVDSAEPHLDSWQLLAKENNHSVTREQFAATFGRQNNDIIPLLFGDMDAQRCAALADRKEEIYRDLVRQGPPVVSGAIELIHALHERGVGLAVGSSGPRQNIELVLDAMGVRAMFPVVITGDDVVRGKPDPEVFTLACQGLETEAVRCVVVEDSPAGIAAAIAAGTRTIAILMHHPAESFENADCIVDRLSELTPEKLESLVV